MKAIEFGYLGNESDGILSDMCKQVWNSSSDVEAARKKLADTLAAAVKADDVVSSIIDCVRKECVARVCNVLMDGTKVDEGKKSELEEELTAYLCELSVVDGLPYNYVTKSVTYLDTENRKESFCAGLYQEYMRIKRVAGAQKKEKSDKVENMLRQLKLFGIEKEIAITRAVQMYSVTEGRAEEVWNSINI